MEAFAWIPARRYPLSQLGAPPCPRQRSPKAPSVCPPVCDQEDETRFYVWLIALATLLAVGAAILLCKK